MNSSFPISLVIPVHNEGATIAELIQTIHDQTIKPQEIVIVDGGSTDDTVDKIKRLTSGDNRFRIIEAGPAMPGVGRNIGVAHAAFDWIAFTDAGIRLDPKWLEELTKKAMGEPGASIVYGNFSPVTNHFFEKCAAISYAAPQKQGMIRTKFIASCLLKKEVWFKAGGFPEWRATEDLMFMEKAEQLGFKFAFAPEAMVHWKLRPDLGSTFRKFELYSKYNVWAGRQAYWHYGIARQWALVLLSILAAILFHWYWILFVPLWMIARAMKRIGMHRKEFGIACLFNPAIIFMVIIITFTIDMASFSGWIRAIFHKQPGSGALWEMPGNTQ